MEGEGIRLQCVWRDNDQSVGLEGRTGMNELWLAGIWAPAQENLTSRSPWSLPSAALCVFK